MVLDDQREVRFDETIRKYEVEHTMETLSPYQKRFIAKGKQEALLDFLEVRFGQVPGDIAETLHWIDSPALLKKLTRAAGVVTTLEEFRSILSS
jgi:hypothetical protein